jgi:hypothetical protein
MPCLPDVERTYADTIHSSVRNPPLKPNGRTIGSRSNPQLIFAIVIALQPADADGTPDVDNIPGAIATAIPGIMKSLLFINRNPISLM